MESWKLLFSAVGRYTSCDKVLVVLHQAVRLLSYCTASVKGLLFVLVSYHALAWVGCLSYDITPLSAYLLLRIFKARSFVPVLVLLPN